MKILVAVASKHGSTLDIGETVADELRTMEHETEVRNVSDVTDLSRYDAVILGSAVYMGRWLPDALAFVETQRAALNSRPVWLFSSGPLGADQPVPPGDPQHLDSVMETTRARGHRTFSGRLEPGDLGLGERLIAKVVHAPTGDFRDWDAIRSWTREIGSALRAAGGDADATGGTHTAA